VDRLFTRVGAADRLGAGQSTFMVEMTETADILRSATSRSLVLLDEIGRGTATYDGLALAWAVTEHLHDARAARARTIFATHYHELTQLSERLPRLANAHVTVKEWGTAWCSCTASPTGRRSQLRHPRRPARRPAASVIERAKVVLAELESERTVEELERRPVRSRKEEIRVPLPLFDVAPPPEHPLAAELRALAPDAMTPLEALQTARGVEEALRGLERQARLSASAPGAARRPVRQVRGGLVPGSARLADLEQGAEQHLTVLLRSLLRPWIPATPPAASSLAGRCRWSQASSSAAFLNHATLSARAAGARRRADRTRGTGWGGCRGSGSVPRR
jgi:hypothetical protein